MSEYKELSCLAYDLRKKVVEMVVSGKGGHIGGDMSVIDVLVALYFKEMNISPKNMDDPDRDRFVMSKGHSVEAYYAVLAAKGFFPMEEVIEKFSKFGSPYIGHPNNKLPGIEMNSGSLGHGLPVCVGMALAGKMDKKDYRVYTVKGCFRRKHQPYHVYTEQLLFLTHPLDLTSTFCSYVLFSSFYNLASDFFLFYQDFSSPDR